jgi:putative ABC transport system permease protein
MTQLVSDFRFAIRMLLRRPAATVLVVLVMSLGIGTTTAVVTVVDHVLFRPLALPQSERIVTVCQTHPQGMQFCGASPPNLTDWERRTHMLAAVGIGRAETMALRGPRGATNLSVGMATAGFLRALGVAPAWGRLIGPDDVPPRGDGKVVVLSDELWQSEFGGAPDIVGRRVTLDEESYAVVGVLPSGLAVPRLEYARAWRPLPFDPATEEYRDWRGFVALGRLAPQATLEEAEAELAAIHRGVVASHPDVLAGSGVSLQRLREYLTRPVRTTLLVFLGTVLVVLAVVAVNVASLQLARATAREREFVVRTALGATRSTLARQLLIEGAVLAALGGIGGVLTGLWATELFRSLAPPGIPRLDEIRVDLRVLAFAVAATGLAGIGFGLAPLSRLHAMVVATGLREGRGLSGTRATQRARRALVVTQLALALMLLIGGGLLLRSFGALLAWKPGFDTDHVLTFQLYPGMGRYPDRAQVLALYRRLEGELRGLPGVRSVGMVSAGPLFGGGDGDTPFQIEGRPPLPLDQAPTVWWYDMSPDYFPTLGVPLREGRWFSETEVEGTARVALVNQTFARRYWPDRSAVGARLSFPELSGLEAEIIGVVGDIQPFDAGTPPLPELYFTNRQFTRWATYFVLRTERDAAALAGAVAAALAAEDAELVPSHLQTLRQLAARERVGPRFNLALVGLFALVALVLAVVGVYGVMAYTVALRTHEIGVRLAIGADQRRVVQWIGAEGLRITAAGVVLGTAGALLFSRFLEGMLHGVPPTDPASYAVTVALLVAAALMACLVPAIRASRTDPTVAIRQE